MRSISISFLLVLASITSISKTFAEVKAVVNGPKQSKTGSLFVLSAEQSIADGVRWVSPEGVATLTCSERELATAIGTPGRYTFTLIVADKNANIDYVQHTVVVGDIVPVPDPEPDKPEPDKPTPGKFESLRKLSASASGSVNDPSTASGLAEAIRETESRISKMCETGQCPGIVEAKSIMVAAIEKRLSQRTGASLRADWLGLWRRPINFELIHMDIADVPSYLSAMLAIATGLGQK